MVYSIGCSGFHYKHWKGDFYPKDLPEKKWFEYYCRFFNTLELNVTFYRFPQLSVLDKWYQGSPEQFVFSVKAPRIITHFKKLLGAASMIDDFYRIVAQGLKHKTGCILFQFPPNFVYSEARLERIIDSLNPLYRNIVEFRHISWWQDEVYNILGKHQIGFCGMNHPEFPVDIISNTPYLYYRLHGNEKLYASDYTREELDQLASEINSLPNIKAVYIYFNNDAKGYAVSNAQYLINLLKR